MANYNLVVDSTFRPFTYDELSKPLIQATQLHREVEEKYGDLDLEASIWEGLANEEKDPKTYAQYKRYADDLHAAAESLNRYGLDPRTTATLQKMRGRYGSEIKPIETAYNRRKELADEQRKMIAANPTQLYERMADQMSLDEFLNNPAVDYGRTYSGAMITQQVATAAANLAKEARDSEEGRRKLRKLLPYQYELVEQNGFSHDAVMKAILNEPNADQILTGLVDSAMQTSGIYNWEGDQSENIARALDYARQGLYSAIGDTKYSNITDSYNMQRQLQIDAHNLTIPQENHLIANPKNIFQSKGEMEVANMMNKFGKYFDRREDGSWVLNQKGKDAYYMNPDPSGWSGGTMHNEFREFMDSLGADKYISKASGVRGSWADDAVYQPGNVGNLWGQYLKEHDSASAKYDATKSTEFSYAVDPSQNTMMKDQILANSGDGKYLYIVDLNDTNPMAKFTRTDKIKKEDFDKNYRVVETRYSYHGNTAIVIDDKGQRHRIELPAAINPTASENINNQLMGILTMQEIAYTGEYTDRNGIRHKLSNKERQEVQKQYSELVEELSLTQGNIGSTFKHTEQKVPASGTFLPYGNLYINNKSE